MLYIYNGDSNVFRCNLHGVVWKHTGGLMYFKNIPGKYGKYIDGIDRNYFLWGVDNCNYVNGYTQW